MIRPRSPMLYDPARHEPLRALAWDEDRARATIARIARDAEARFTPDRGWPLHPLDADGGETAPAFPLYHGACGVLWALQYLRGVGAVSLQRDYAGDVAPLLARNRAWLASFGGNFEASYLMGDTGILLLDYAMSAAGPPQGANSAPFGGSAAAPAASVGGRCTNAAAATADRLAALIAANVDNPARELMWGAPGTLLAALFLHERTHEARWAELFRTTARTLWSQLEWSPQFACRYFTQDMYGVRSTYLDAVHGFVATASPLIRGRHLLGGAEWAAWQACIADTIRKSATRDGDLVNWRAWLYTSPGRAPAMLMQYCHGAPGFVVCLGEMPEASLDDLLLAAGETTWRAGPLRKGSNLCHGTAGNGYAFLKLYARTRDPQWLERARAFAMHAIAQTEADERRFGQMRYSLWTGDPGVAVYLLDCIHGRARFPALDVFFAETTPRTSPAPA